MGWTLRGHLFVIKMFDTAILLLSLDTMRGQEVLLPRAFPIGPFSLF